MLLEALDSYMTSGVPQANIFYSQVSETREVWFGVMPGNIFLEFVSTNKDRGAIPVWSSKSRIERLIKLNPDLLGDVSIRGTDWDSFKAHIVPIFKEKNLMAGVNYSGKNLSGIDIEIDLLISQVEAHW
jgi:hypothetical protein